MRSLNQHLARRANDEDQCKGRFWEGRYKSQALLDEAAVLTAMSYVDLNPIRVGMATTPEASDFTSIKQRIDEHATDSRKQCSDSDSISPRLIPLKSKRKRPHQLCFDKLDYLALVDWAGRAIRSGKREFIAAQVPPILDRMGLAPEIFLRQLGRAGATSRPTMLGHVVRISAAA